VTRQRLLAVGEGLSTSGYARVMESVLAPLSRAFDVTLFATNHLGPPEPRPFGVRTNELLGDVYGYEQLPGMLDELEPDVVLLHRDSGFHSMHRTTLAAYTEGRPGARVAVYCPVDWPRTPPAVPHSLAAADLVVLYSRYGLETIERAFGDEGLEPPATAVIGHGVDCGRFRPLVRGDPGASRAEARRRLFGGEPGIEDAFIVLNANRNQRRKRIDITLRGFAEFARGRPDARLYLHMGMRDLGCDVRALAEELDIAGRLLTTTDGDDPPAETDERLNLIYNACDVGLNTAEAEGWGLVSFEHAAAGAAQVVPDHGACAELWAGSALLLPARREERRGHLVEPAAVAATLGRLRDDVALRREMAERALRLAREPRFSWEAIGARWEDALRECLRRPASRSGSAAPTTSPRSRPPQAAARTAR
jgi:glycosyltransferase involved in cell wall biosynthesis